MLGRDDLVLTGSTLGNPPLPELIEAAVAGGFAGLSLWPQIYFASLARGLSVADMRSALDSHGIVVNDVDAVVAWVGSERPAVIDPRHPSEAQVYEAGQALGARCVNIVFAGGDTLSVDEGAEIFAGMCERAAEHGLTAHIEFVPSMSPLSDAATTWEVIVAAGRPEAGILLDTWHCHCGTTTDEDLRALPGERVLGIQINDAPDRPVRELIRLGMTERMVPGEGSLDLVGFIRILDEIGCDAPLTVEVYSDELKAACSPLELSKRLGHGIREVRGRARDQDG